MSRLDLFYKCYLEHVLENDPATNLANQICLFRSVYFMYLSGKKKKIIRRKRLFCPI